MMHVNIWLIRRRVLHEQQAASWSSSLTWCWLPDGGDRGHLRSAIAEHGGVARFRLMIWCIKGNKLLGESLLARWRQKKKQIKKMKRSSNLRSVDGKVQRQSKSKRGHTGQKQGAHRLTAHAGGTRVGLATGKIELITAGWQWEVAYDDDEWE